MQIDQRTKVIMHQVKRFIFLLTTSSLFFQCEYFRPQEQAERTPVAKVGESYLYLDELEGLVPKNVAKEDSAKLSDKYVNDWVKKQLIVDKALSEIAINQAEIERKVEDYRYALISHEFEKLYINSHLDTYIDQDEIDAYYLERSENFILKQNIVKCLFVQVPKNAPSLNQFRRNIRSYPNTNVDDIKDYSFQYAIKSFMDDSVWVNFDELIINTPLKNITNKIQFLQQTSFSETSDENYTYFLKILDYKISDQVSPLEFIREDIENIIINKRKLALKKELEKAIYDDAISNKSFEIYNN